MLNSSAARRPFCVDWAHHCTDTRFYVAALSILFFLGFRQWRSWSCADMVLTLNMTSDFHCFGALGVWPWARTRPDVRAWRMGVTLAIVAWDPPRSKSHKRCLAHGFPWIVERFSLNWPKGQLWGFFNPHPQTGLYYGYTCPKILNLILIWKRDNQSTSCFKVSLSIFLIYTLEKLYLITTKKLYILT